MEYRTIEMRDKKHIALVAHDNKKKELLEWVEFNINVLAEHILYATGTTGTMLETLALEVIKLQSGPLGGDQQIGAMIADGIVEMVIFFVDPLESHPHATDIQSLVRLAAVWNIPIACTRAAADFMISSSLMNEKYKRLVPDYEEYKNRLTAPDEPRATTD
jgi:methylglyoxal synthase